MKKTARWQIISTLADGTQPVKLEVYNTKKAALYRADMMQNSLTNHSKYLYKVVKI